MHRNAAGVAFAALCAAATICRALRHRQRVPVINNHDDNSDQYETGVGGGNGGASGDTTEATTPQTVFVWSHPRALSTALLRSLAEHSNITTVLEPFMVPWQVDLGVYRGTVYAGPNTPSPPNFEDVIRALLAANGSCNSGADDASSTKKSPHVQVVKDMPCHGGTTLLERVLHAFPSAKHVLLVRHPFRAIPSYLRVSVGYSDEVMRADISYAGLLQYAELLIRRQQGDDDFGGGGGGGGGLSLIHI